MAHYMFLCCMLSIITLGLAALFFAGIKTKDDQMITYGALGGCLCFGLLYLVWSEHDAKLVEAADEFFATREDVYKCQEHQDLKCQYKIMKWQADSIDWTNRVQKVMRKNNVYCKVRRNLRTWPLVPRRLIPTRPKVDSL